MLDLSKGLPEGALDFICLEVVTAGCCVMQIAGEPLKAWHCELRPECHLPSGNQTWQWKIHYLCDFPIKISIYVIMAMGNPI